MPTKTLQKNSTAQKPQAPDSDKNGSQSSEEHLEKANKAMDKAWTLISRRQNKRG